MAREGTLQAKVVKAIKAEFGDDVWTFNVHGSPYQMGGVPDLVGCVRGCFFGVELKARGPGESEAAARNRATDLQKLRISDINTAGGVAGVALTVDEALEIVRRASVKLI